jgi:hypothetical protein
MYERTEDRAWYGVVGVTPEVVVCDRSLYPSLRAFRACLCGAVVSSGKVLRASASGFN